MSEEWWLCGQTRGGPNAAGRYTWDFQGIFDSEEKAQLACRNQNYFIFPIELNKEYPDEPIVEPKGYYPLG